MATFYIDPTAAKAGTGTAAHPFNSWSQVSFAAGDTYLQKAGTTANGSITVTASGTAARPITIGAYGSGAAPVINGVVNLDGASYFSMSGLTVLDSAGPAVAIQNGASHVSIIGNDLTNSSMGLWIGNGAGADNLIYANTITGNTLDGLAVDKIANPAGHATEIAGNTISGNGIDGIELDGSNFVLAGNTTDGNGLTTSGASGIHVFSGAGNDGYGIGNVIIDNVAVGNRDPGGGDGNGIELDQYTSGNYVADNLAYANAGAGIVLYDSSGNLVASNLVDGNGADGVPGNFVLVSSLGLTQGNVIADNTGISASSTPAVFIAQTSAAQGNIFTGNIWENSTGAPATAIGIDVSWADWQAFDLVAAASGAVDHNSGVALDTGSVGQVLYTFPTGTTQTINGVSETLVGWSPGTLAVSGQAQS
jgi:parallel beta-helix repeat protein